VTRVNQKSRNQEGADASSCLGVVTPMTAQTITWKKINLWPSFPAFTSGLFWTAAAPRLASPNWQFCIRFDIPWSAIPQQINHRKALPDLSAFTQAVRILNCTCVYQAYYCRDDARCYGDRYCVCSCCSRISWLLDVDGGCVLKRNRRCPTDLPELQTRSC